MKILPFHLDCLSHASYLVLDERTRSAAVIDPQRDVQRYLDEARALGARIEHVFLTHFHADFVAGHLELVEHTGATIHMGARAATEFPVVHESSGTTTVLGDVRLVTRETPGHTPEGISILAYDDARDPSTPQAVFTGDTLFAGDVGRPDLLASVGHTAEELGQMLFHSLREQLLSLPDETVVYPAHFAGSLCGKALSAERQTTIGHERAHNPALAIEDPAAFLAFVTADQPTAPRYFVHDAILNRRLRPTLDEQLERSLVALGLERVDELVAEGAQLLDVRDADAFAAGHLAGSLNVGIDDRFASWAGTLLDLERPIVVVAAEGREREAVLRLMRVGLDRVLGYLDGGQSQLNAHPQRLQRVERVPATGLAAHLAAHPQLRVLDVRGAAERERGAWPDSLHVPLPELEARLGELPRTGGLVLHCAGGYRSSSGASLLRAAGFPSVTDVRGGWNALVAAGAVPATTSCSTSCSTEPGSGSCAS